jgi:hypothetical protein
MNLSLEPREVAQLLAALRFWQQIAEQEPIADNEYEAYFEEHEPLSSAEIDALCRRIAESAAKS